MKHVLKEQQAMALFLLKSSIYTAAEGLKQSGLCKLLAGRDALHSASRCLTELSGEVGCVGLACPGTCPPAPPGAVLASLSAVTARSATCNLKASSSCTLA